MWGKMHTHPLLIGRVHWFNHFGKQNKNAKTLNDKIFLHLYLSHYLIQWQDLETVNDSPNMFSDR